MVAVVQSVLHNFSIVTGGPGTGKTTTVAKILAVLLHLNPECRIALCAPTGKAAMRMAESLKNTNLPIDDSIKTVLKNLSPNTIHRLLRYVPESINFKHNKSNPLPYDVVVVDEASMLDVALFAKLLEAVGDKHPHPTPTPTPMPPITIKSCKQQSNLLRLFSMVGSYWCICAGPKTAICFSQQNLYNTSMHLYLIKKDS